MDSLLDELVLLLLLFFVIISEASFRGPPKDSRVSGGEARQASFLDSRHFLTQASIAFLVGASRSFVCDSLRLHLAP